MDKYTHMCTAISARLVDNRRSMARVVKRIDAALPQIVQATLSSILFTASHYGTTPITSSNTLQWT